ncbi:MAG: MmgE/PrpD family protein [Desulfohalobiaceae bacterium]|nr:MmgE/PrpD family protein [Desulfohalobiaceae bacterium]
MEVTKQLCEFIQDFHFEKIPDEVLNKAKICILDCMGCAAGGIVDDCSQVIHEYTKDYAGRGQSTIFGMSTKTDPAHAALANGIIAHALDFDDYHGETITHGTAACLPAILSVVEERNLSGKDILTALVLGIEISTRIGLGLGTYHYELGWHTTSTAGRFGATAAVGKLVGLQEKQLRHAFGLCGTQNAGLRQVFGTMGKPFNAGKPAMDGVMSVFLAEKGFTCSTEILEGELGILTVMTETPFPDRILEGLGEKYHILDISLKPYPTCA